MCRFSFSIGDGGGIWYAVGVGEGVEEMENLRAWSQALKANSKLEACCLQLRNEKSCIHTFLMAQKSYSACWAP